MFFIRLYPNGVTHRQEDGILFYCQAPVMFQHPRIRTLKKLQQVMLSNLGDRVSEITEIEYSFLSPQPNRRPVRMLVWLLNDEHVRVTFECHRRLMAETIMEFLVVVAEASSPSVPQPDEPPGPPIHATPLWVVKPVGEGVEAEIGSSDFDSDYLGESASSSEGLNDDGCIPDTPSGGRPRYILPLPLPIPRVEDVLCFYQQDEFDALQISDPMKAGIVDDYDIDGGVEDRISNGPPYPSSLMNGTSAGGGSMLIPMPRGTSIRGV
ncbi:hypothetical protein PIB30_085486 [Stylosanthes scabra]|uniref:Uncharacterized protein n=1 Tax=Stylosanthes scabra TaxID=79078 RepID=A0ABU6YQG0_9FABA|nr:hypothetical protein [Stylosanthes scabra]